MNARFALLPVLLTGLVFCSCIHEKRDVCPAPFTAALDVSVLPDGSHGLDLSVEGDDDGYPLSASFMVDGKPAKTYPEQPGGSYPVQAGGDVSVSLARLPAGRHTVMANVTDGDYVASDKVELEVGGVSVEASFKTVPGGATVATLALVDGDPVPYDVSFLLDGDAVRDIGRQVVFGKDREIVLTLPHREPGGHVLVATFENGNFSQTIEFPFEAVKPVVSVGATLQEKETSITVSLDEGDVNTVYSMSLLLDGKAVSAKGKGFSYDPSKVVFPSGRRLQLSIPAVTEPGSHVLSVTLADGGFSTSAETTFTVDAVEPFVPGLSVKRSGKDLWDVVVTTVSGEPEGTFSVVAKLDGREAPGFLTADGKTVGGGLKFGSENRLPFRLGPVPVGRHTLSLTLKRGGESWPLGADLTEDRLGIALSFEQKTYECCHGYFGIDGYFTSNLNFNCVIHENMTMSVQYGWKGAYSIEVYMKKVGGQDEKVEWRYDVREQASSVWQKNAVAVPVETSVDLSTGKCLFRLPFGGVMEEKKTEKYNVVRVRVTPRWDGGTTAEFSGSFEAPFDRVNGFFISAGDNVNRKLGEGGPNPVNKDSGFGFVYKVNWESVSNVSANGVTKTNGQVFALPRYYKDNPPTLVVEDPSICGAELGRTYNLVNVYGKKAGETRLYLRLHDAVAEINVTVMETRAGELEVRLGIPEQ